MNDVPAGVYACLLFSTVLIMILLCSLLSLLMTMPMILLLGGTCIPRYTNRSSRIVVKIDYRNVMLVNHSNHVFYHSTTESLKWYVASNNAATTTSAGFTSVTLSRNHGMKIVYYDQVGCCCCCRCHCLFVCLLLKC